MNEPATGEISALSMLGKRDGETISHNQFHNEYALLMAQSTFEGLQKSQPNERSFILSRAGSAGIQRYAANWMGDSCSSWEHLQMGMPMAMGLGLSGQAFVGGDIGGFFQATEQELFSRWLQASVFTSFFRNHNDDERDQYAWSFGEFYLDLARQAINLRYQVLPYLYTAFHQSSLDGSPIQQPLVYQYPDDPACREIEDQFLCGESLLIAPVMEKNASSRNIYLPDTEWYEWQSDKSHTGKQVIRQNVEVDSIPIFVKAGSVIPLNTEVFQTTMDHKPDTVHLDLYIPSDDGKYSSTLYEDDGHSLGYEKGSYLKSHFSIVREGKSLRFSGRIEGGSYPHNKRRYLKLKFYGAEIQFNGKVLREYTMDQQMNTFSMKFTIS